MDRFEIALEVAPIEPDVVEALKGAGHTVYRGSASWRVVAIGPAVPWKPVRDQANAFAHDLVLDFGLVPLNLPPVVALRDPDATLDTIAAELVLEDARRAYDPDPLTRAPRRWWQKQMELGLGERKGD